MKFTDHKKTAAKKTEINLAGRGSSSSSRPALFLWRHGNHVPPLYGHILLLRLGCCCGDDLLLWRRLSGHLSWFLFDYYLQNDRQSNSMTLYYRNVH